MMKSKVEYRQNKSSEEIMERHELIDNSDYQRMARAIAYLARNFHEQPSLDEIAASVHLSKFHFQRMFTRWAGISPKKYLQYLTLNAAKDVLVHDGSVLDAAYESGLSGPGRLHDLFVTHESLTPGEYKTGGDGMRIRYGMQSSPFGLCLIAATERGICGLSFHDTAAEQEALENLRRNWPGAHLVRDDGYAREVLQTIFDGVDGAGANPDKPSAGDPARTQATSLDQPIHLVLKGTPFQIKVWEALISIPAGKFASYKEIARTIDCPNAARAVGNALNRNPVAYLIPCHRVIRTVGGLGGYRWGQQRKQVILAWEAAQQMRDSALAGQGRLQAG